MFNNIKITNNKLYSSLLLSFFPISFILGNLAINLNIILIILFSLFIFKIEREDNKINLVFFDKLIIFFFVYIFFVTLLNYIKLPQSDQSNQLIIKSFSYLRYLIFYFSIRYLIKKNYFDLKLFFFSCSVCVIFVSLDIIFQYNFGRDIFNFKAVPRRMSGPFGDELIAGGYLSRFSLIFIFLFCVFGDLNKIHILKKLTFYLTTFLVLSFGLILAGNRVPFFIFFTMIFLCFFLVKNYKTYFFSFFIIAAFSLISLMNYDTNIRKHYGGFQTKIINFLQPFSDDKKIEYKDLKNLTNTEREYTFSYKGDVFIAPTVHTKEFYTGIKTWSKNKFLGGGLKSFRFNCPKVFINCNAHPHNYYLEILSDLGLVGFFLIISLLIYIFYKSYLSKKIIIVPFSIILFGEMFPLKTMGSFFSTSNSTFIFLLFSLIIGILNRKDLK